MKITFKQLKRLVCESNIYDDYEDLLCEFFDVDDISKITPWMYKKALQDYEYNNLNEHDSSLLEDATLLVHEAAKQHGYNIIAHHGTNKKFSEFKYGDIGFHLGTLEQARLAGKSHTPFGAGDDEIVFLNVALSLHNPLILESDPESWAPDDIIDGALNLIYRYRRLVGLDEKEDFHTFAKNQEHIDLVDKKIKDAIQNGNIVIDSEEKYDRSSISFLILYQLLKFTLSEIINLRIEKVDTKKALVNRAKSLGYDGIKYLNLFEVDHESDEKEYSYIVFNANQIKNCEVISFKGGKIVPLEERFNSSTNNLFESKKDKAYLMVLEIFNTLTDEEKWLVSPRHGMLKNVPVLYRYVIPHKAFIDIYPYNNNSKIGFILLAVNPEYRRMRMTQRLIQRTIENCKCLGIKKLIWRCDSNNIGSYKAAIANGFKLKTKGKTYYSFEMVIE